MTLTHKILQEAKSSTDCRDEEGVTVGLIDSLIAIARVLSKRDLHSHDAQEALEDLRDDEDIHSIVDSD